ncbi:MAG: LytR/AlgR family response regulator transcription factor [bacterium]
MPVLIYEPDEARRAVLSNILMQLPGAATLIKIDLITGSANGFGRMLAEISGSALVILGMALRPENNRERCLEFGSALAMNNRDCYTVYDIYDLDDLTALLPRCSRPAGILLGNYTAEQAIVCFERILSDYASITNDSASTETLLLESGSTTYRIPYGQILYIEALNKKLNICTMRQSLSIRASISSIADTLPEQFLRCHRSYIINLRHVEQTDYRDMLVTMTDGSRLPIARSMKDALQSQLTAKKGSSA